MKTFFLIFGFMLLWACSSKDKLPENVLDKEEMVGIFIEKYIVEGKLIEAKLKTDSAQAVFAYGKSRILEEKGITEEVYKESMVYYNGHPKQLEAIFETVLDSLNLRKQRADAKDKLAEPE